MHPDQLEVDVSTARTLIAAQFPHWRHLEVARVDGSGTVNAIFRIGDELTGRFPLLASEPKAARAALEQEAGALAEFASVCPFAAPRPVAIGAPDAEFPMPWTVQTWVSGEVATPIGSAHSLGMAEDLAALIRALRRAPVRGRRFRGQGRGGVLSDHDEWVQHCLAQVGPLMDAEPLRAMWEEFRSLPSSGPDVMTHSDLTPWNLLVDGGRLRGVLDAGWFGPADPALDLVCAWHVLDAPARTVLREAVGADDVEWARGAAWAFEQALGLVWYYRATNPPMAWLGDVTLARLLAARESGEG